MSIGVLAETGARVCSSCGSELAPGFLVCPGCARLIHAEDLKRMAAEAAAAAEAGRLSDELGAWRASLELLPSSSKQFEIVRARVEELSRRAETASPAPNPQSPRWKWLGPFAPAALVVWKFKVIILAVVTKGKFLLLGLTKASTVLSMLLAFGVYWSQWGAWFALGVVVSIYIHEMGHVAALRQYGIAASAPMFIPGVGALVRLKQTHLTRRENARVGLAGPIWGTAAAVAALAIGTATGHPLWIAIAHIGAWINLFNLLPVWQLDGNRGFASLVTRHRWYAVAALAVAWSFWQDGLFVLLLIVAVVRAAGKDAPEDPDSGALGSYVGLVLVLGLVGSSALPR